MIKGKLFVKNKINPRDENYALSFDFNPPNIDYQLAKLLKLRNNSNESRNKIYMVLSNKIKCLLSFKLLLINLDIS